MKIETQRIFFIDCIGDIIKTKDKNVLFTKTPSNLTAISIALNQLIPIVGDHGFIIMDSLSTLLIHNKPETVIKFIHFLTSKLASRKENIISTFFATKEGLKILEQIMPFFDRVISSS